jgi:hypothetical protein
MDVSELQTHPLGAREPSQPLSRLRLPKRGKAEAWGQTQPRGVEAPFEPKAVASVCTGSRSGISRMSVMGGKQTLTQAADMQCIGTCHISRARPNLLRWLLLP